MPATRLITTKKEQHEEEVANEKKCVASDGYTQSRTTSLNTTVKSNSGLAGKYKSLHEQLLFVDRSLDFHCQQGVALSVKILTNIPIQEEMEGDDRIVIASRVHMFRVEMITSMNESPDHFFTVLDVVYLDSGEKVVCLSDKTALGTHVLENERTSRFDPVVKCDNSVKVEDCYSFATFNVKFRETNRQHVHRDKGKKMQRKFCFRISIFRTNLESDEPSIQRCYVADSVSFNVLERRTKNSGSSSSNGSSSNSNRSSTAIKRERFTNSKTTKITTRIKQESSPYNSYSHQINSTEPPSKRVKLEYEQHCQVKKEEEETAFIKSESPPSKMVKNEHTIPYAIDDFLFSHNNNDSFTLKLESLPQPEHISCMSPPSFLLKMEHQEISQEKQESQQQIQEELGQNISIDSFLLEDIFTAPSIDELEFHSSSTTTTSMITPSETKDETASQSWEENLFERRWNQGLLQRICAMYASILPNQRSSLSCFRNGLEILAKLIKNGLTRCLPASVQV